MAFYSNILHEDYYLLVMMAFCVCSHLAHPSFILPDVLAGELVTHHVSVHVVHATQPAATVQRQRLHVTLLCLLCDCLCIFHPQYGHWRGHQPIQQDEVGGGQEPFANSCPTGVGDSPGGDGWRMGQNE